MHLKDWTNRKAAGLSLLGLALSFAVPAYVSQSTLFSAIAATLVLMGITVLGIDLWSRRKVAIGVEAFMDYLSHILSTSEHIFISGFDKRKFAVLRVTNTGSKNLKKVVARCQFDGGAEEYGIWSLDSGDQFTSGGSHKADLDVGDSRYLVVAQGFGADKLWARLPRQQPFGWPPRATDVEGVVSYVDVSGQVLSIPGDLVITVRLASKDLQRFARRFRLDFDGDEPRITPRGMKPRHQPAVVEQLHEWERSVDEA
jgi:hypothetical protein